MSKYINKDIQRIINTVIKEDLNDAIFKEIITIKDVVGEGGFYKVYFNVGYDNSNTSKRKEKDVLIALTKASGYIRSRISKALKLKRAPELRFEIDTLSEEIEKIEKVIKENK